MNIGISMHGAKDSTSINTAYLEYVLAAGLNPILITKQSNINLMADLCDGLLLPGGVDIEPTFYMEDNLASANCSPEKDAFERKLMGEFIGRNKKIFGICRGFQLITREFLRIFEHKINSHYFYQHVNDHNHVNARNIARNVPSHNVKVSSKRLYNTKEPEKIIYVNSIHHQALVCSVAAGNVNITIDDNNKLIALGVTSFSAPKVGATEGIIIEAVDVTMGGSKLRGVQWHPEELMDTALLQSFFLNKVVENKNGTANI